MKNKVFVFIIFLLVLICTNYFTAVNSYAGDEDLPRGFRITYGNPNVGVHPWRIVILINKI